MRQIRSALSARLLMLLLPALLLLSVAPCIEAEEAATSAQPRKSATFVEPESVIRELGGVHRVTAVRLMPAADANIAAFDVYASLDGETYHQVAYAENTAQGTDGMLENAVAPAVYARVVKAVLHRADPAKPAGTCEWLVTTQAATESVTLLGEAGSAQAASYSWVTKQPFVTPAQMVQADPACTRLTDGDREGLCESGTGAAGSYGALLFDLGDTYQLDTLTLWGRGVDTVELKVSVDGKNYTSCGRAIGASSQENVSGISASGLPGVHARYVKVLAHCGADEMALSEVALTGWPLHGGTSAGAQPERVVPRVTLRQFSLAHIDWSGYDAAGNGVEAYALYIETAPFESVSGLVPKATWDQDSLEFESGFASYLGLEPEETYYFAVTPFGKTGERKDVTAVRLTTGPVLGTGEMGDIFGMNYNPDEGGGFQVGHGEYLEQNLQTVLELVRENGGIVRNRWWNHEEAVYEQFADYGMTYHLYYHGPDNLPLDNSHGVWTFSSVNEPENKGTMPATTLAPMIMNNYATLKPASPKSLLVEPAMAGVDAGRLEYIEALYRADGAGGAIMKDSFDVMDVHPYVRLTDQPMPGGVPIGSPEMILSKIDDLRATMAKFGDADKPIMFTEIGWTTSYNGNTGVFVTRDTQRDYLARVYLISAARDIKQVMWYDFQDDGMDMNYNEHGFGLIDYFGVPKTSYYGHYNLSGLMKHAVYVQDVVGMENPNYGYQFWDETKNQYVTALWTADVQERAVELTDVGNEVRLYNIDGSAQRVPVENDKALIGIGPTPVLVYTDTPVQVSRVGDAFTLSADRTEAFRGETLSVTIQRAALGRGEVMLGAELPKNWNFTGENHLAADRAKTTLIVSIPQDAAEGEQELLLPVYESGRVLTTLHLPVVVKDTVGIAASPYLSNKDGWQLAVTLTNQSERPISGQANAKAGVYCKAGAEEPVPFAELAPGESGTVLLPMAQVMWRNKAEVLVTVGLSDGYQKTENISLDLSVSVQDDDVPIVDGVASPGEWDDAPPINLKWSDQATKLSGWAGVEDLSAVTRFKWDENRLYMLSEVRDNTWDQRYVDDQIWNGDSVQFGLDMSRKDGKGSANYHEMGFALTDSGMSVWRWTAANGLATGRLDAAEAQAVRTADGITYELSIPWTELTADGKAPTVGSSLGFSMLVNDSDGSGRRGWMEFMSGIGSSKNTDLFGELVFICAEA